MVYDPQKHHRRSIRLRGYDYSQPNPYYLTLCAQEGLCLFGDVVDGEMHLNSAGNMIDKWWKELEPKFPNTLTDSFQIMPNHLHAVLVILGNGLDMASLYGFGLDRLDFANTEENEGIVASLATRSDGANTNLNLRVDHEGVKRSNEDFGPHKTKLGEMMQWFKTMATNEYIRGVRDFGWQRFPGKLWQRNYFEHVVRQEQSLERIRE